MASSNQKSAVLKSGGNVSRCVDKALYLTETVSATASTSDILGVLRPEDRDEILKHGQRRYYAPGDHFFQQGEPHDGIHIIEFGRVRSYYTSPAGREITLAHWTTGHFVGAPQVFSGGCYMWSIVAIEPTRGVWLRGPVLKALAYRIPDLAMSLIEGLEQKGMCLTAVLQLLATRSMSKRLAHLLLTLAEQQGNRSNGHIALDRRFTHEELASMIGSTRQWVSQSLERFEKDGIVTRDSSRIVVLDEERLLERSM